jgi:hypothetical protein
LQIQEQRKFVNENGNIYINPIENENILENQKIRGEKRNHDVTVPWQQEQRILENNFYERRKKRKEKYKMTNMVVYDLNDLAYLIV